MPERLIGLVTACRSERKLRLLACAVIRHAPFHPDGRSVWDLLPESRWFAPGRPESRWNLNLREVVAAAEQHADGRATADEWETAQGIGSGADWAAVTCTPAYNCEPQPGCWLAYLPVAMVYVATLQQQEVTRRLLGYRDTFRVACPDGLHPGNGAAVCALIRDTLLGPQRRKPINLVWITASVRELAGVAYEGHQFDRLPVLADALEKAGCTDRAMLRHCREPGLHARGCWVLDRVLGLE
ncbi:MAG: hypothetical protein JWO38_3873 [Gemmataceae bacterium]|nr:hypothetical protein [Gemmataceae bacterium]